MSTYLLRDSLKKQTVRVYQMSQPPQQQQRQRRPPPNLPPEEPAIPIEPAEARKRSALVKEAIAILKTMKDEGKSRTLMEEAVPVFSRDYPKLFSILADRGDFENQSLRTMIAMLDRMGQGEMTQHQASVVVGQRLHDVFIKPVVAELPQATPP